MTPLRQRLVDDLRLRNYSPRTIESYVAGVARLAKHFNRPPDQLGVEDLRRFQLHLLEQQVSWSLFNVVVASLRFFYGTTLGRTDAVPFIAYGKRRRSIPAVLGVDEVRALFEATEPGRDRVLLQTAYACGLRISELVHLQVTDIDSARMQVMVRAGKGNKDRQVPLSERLLVTLRCHWRSHRSRPWLFPGQSADRPLHPTNVQRLFQSSLKRAGKDSSAVLRRCVTAIVPGVNEERLLALRDFSAIRGIQDLNDFMCGWFAAVDASFAPEALRIYTLVFDDPERKKLKGMESLLGGFESFRLGAISLALRTPEGLPVEFLCQINKLHWQSERVIALATLKETGRIEKVETDALKGMVDDPWAGTARYPTGLLRRQNQQVHIDEWMFYGQVLEERSKDVAAHAYLRAFLGQTAIRTSGQGEAAMYPYRIHALRRVVALKPDVFPDLVQFAASEKCPVALRRAVICVYAAEHDRIGKEHIDKIPATMPRDGLSPLSSWYVDGMLKGFDVVRTGKELPAIKSAEEGAVRGYAAVLLSYDRPELNKIAVAALMYKNIDPKLPDASVAVDSAGSGITPFHFMTRDTLLAFAKRLKGSENSERVVGEYGKWTAKVWPAPDVTNVPKNAEEARKGFVAEHRLTETRPDRDVTGEVLRAFQADPSRETALRIVTDWPLYEPDVVVRGLKVLVADKEALDSVGNFVSSVATGSPSSGRAFDRAPNSCVLIQQRAEVLEAVFADLRAFKGGINDRNQRRSLELRIVQLLMKFLDEGPRTIAKCREAAK